MRTGVVVCSCIANVRSWLPECLESLWRVNPIVHFNGPDRNLFEAGGIIQGWSQFDEFWMIPDTVIVKDQRRLLEILEDSGKSYAAGPRFISCIGKLRREVIDAIGLPPYPRNKLDAATLVEDIWFRKYMDYDPPEILDPEFTDKQVFVDRHGRNNMVLESDLFIKYKGTWDLNMIKEGE